MMMPRTILWLALLFGVGGCAWVNNYLAGSDNAPKPAKLEPVEEAVAIEKIWGTRVGSGAKGAFIKLVPAVTEDRIYAASRNGVVKALAADSGQTLWEVDTDLPISAGVGLGAGLALVGASEGQVLALRQEDGGEAWRARVTSEVLAAPRAAADIVVVRSVDGRFTGLDANTGERLWIYSYTMPALTLRGAAPPLLTQNLAVAGLDTGKLLVLSLANGAPIWERTIAPPRGRTELDRMVDIDTEPRVSGGVLYIAAYQGNVTAISLRDGSVLWSRDYSSHAGLDVDARSVYIADASDAVWALDRRSGGSLWKQDKLQGRKLSTPVAGGDYVVIGDFEGYLHWLDKDTGRIVGRTRADKRGVMAAVYGDGRLYVLGAGGSLSAFRAAGG